jgi:spermidine synthase
LEANSFAPLGFASLDGIYSHRKKKLLINWSLKNGTFLRRYNMMLDNNLIHSEMMVHIPMCTHKEAKKVLVVSNQSGIFMEELEKHDAEITYSETFNVEDTFDVVILDGEIDELTMANVSRVLEQTEGVFVCTTAMYQKDSEKMVADLKTVGDNFWISMPYQFGHTVAILASKKFHPQADIILDRSDFLDTQYYYTELQNAAFVLPSYIQKAITGIARR